MDPDSNSHKIYDLPLDSSRALNPFLVVQQTKAIFNINTTKYYQFILLWVLNQRKSSHWAAGQNQLWLSFELRDRQENQNILVNNEAALQLKKKDSHTQPESVRPLLFNQYSLLYILLHIASSIMQLIQKNSLWLNFRHLRATTSGPHH